jgi:hypothetical protein
MYVAKPNTGSCLGLVVWNRSALSLRGTSGGYCSFLPSLSARHCLRLPSFFNWPKCRAFAGRSFLTSVGSCKALLCGRRKCSDVHRVTTKLLLLHCTQNHRPIHNHLHYLNHPHGTKMPSRKSLSSDVTPSSDSRRSSMKRLSSIASLAHLNPFHRRRSNNASDSITSLSSDVSLPSHAASTSTVTASSSRKPSDSSSMLIPSDTAPLVPPTIPIESQASFLRPSSYICLPDDPIGGMPRSRTFSNLPLPTRHRKSESRMPSDSHRRNPSNVTPATRLPTPPASTRRHLMGNIPVATSRYQSVKNRMKRSDTMPLLPLNTDQISNLPRSTAFKENISLSPIKPLPELETFDEADFSSPLPAGSYMEDQLWDQTSSTTLPRDSSFCGTLPMAAYSSDPPLRENFNYYSSPTYQTKQRHHLHSSSFSRSVPVQRWNSQPVLTNTTNVRAAGHHEIRQTRLLSARQAPTPPLSRTPLSVQALGAPATRVRGNSVSSSVHHLRRSSTQTLLNMSTTSQPAAGQVSVSEPTAYWCGRMSGLLDRYRNDDLAIALSDTSSRSDSDRFHSLAAHTERIRRALEHLHSICVTDEARDSFVRFQMQYASSQNLPELSRPIQARWSIAAANASKSVPQDIGLAIGGGSPKTEGNIPKSGNRKISLLNRMLGRREKRESHG